MANEITERGQIEIYGGPQVTLKGSTIGNDFAIIQVREGSGTSRAWKTYDSSKADFLNTKKILYPGDRCLLIAKVLPASFPIQASGGGGNSDPISWPLFTKNSNGPFTLIEGRVNVSQIYLPSFAFTSGSGALQMQLNQTEIWQAVAAIAPGNTAQFRISHSAPFSGVLTLTPQ